jgi:DNA damage-inducible protein 1
LWNPLLDLDKFTQVFREQQRKRKEKTAERIRMLNADPFDLDVQEKIAEEIRLKNVETNMENAMEFAPESFGQVSNCKQDRLKKKPFQSEGSSMVDEPFMVPPAMYFEDGMAACRASLLPIESY